MQGKPLISWTNVEQDAWQPGVMVNISPKSFVI